MRSKGKIKGLLERKLENDEYQKRFDEGYAAFQLEVQILNALERKHMSYSDLARILHTSKSNVSRDLKAGGIRSATFARISKMAKALGLCFLPVFISEEKGKYVIPKIKKIVSA